MRKEKFDIFLDDVRTYEHCYWEIVERDGWFGLKHGVKYLGHDPRATSTRKICAIAASHQRDQYFIIRKYPEGGYQMMMPGQGARHLHFLTIKKGDGLGQKLLTTTDIDNDGVALWDFLKVC